MNQKKEKSLHGGGNSLTKIKRKIFNTQMALIIIFSVILAIAAIFIGVTEKRQEIDKNLKNISEAIVSSPLLKDIDINRLSAEDATYFCDYLGSLKSSVTDIDVISVVNASKMRFFHTTESLSGTVYDGEMPVFADKDFYIVDAVGPSGEQRRAYSAIYDKGGNYAGFLMVIILSKSVKAGILSTVITYASITFAIILCELMLAQWLSGGIKKSLLGYEPDAISAMFSVRDNILESIDEGVVAVDGDGNVLFANTVAEKMLGGQEKSEIIGKNLTSLIAGKELNALLDGDGKEVNVGIKIGDKEALADRVPVRPDGEADKIIILRDRAEYTRLMEELAGTRYLVDSMRANNHDFTNKLHVIMGLIQMGMYDKATDYIQNITMVQREAISKIMNAINEPSMAALLIGKAARASELNVKFALKEGSYFNKSDLWIPTETFITITGNLIQNAFDSLNAKSDDNKQVFVGLYSKPDAVLITVEDSGDGMKQEIIEHIFENGFSTKGEGRGTGLYRVKSLSDEFGGKITVESTVGVGTTVAVSFFRQ
ncbi:MAG: sensor histidine kinase [Acutalibacteraceae bacterium]